MKRFRRKSGKGLGYGKRRIMCVYYLRDPYTSEVRYVGSTKNYLARIEQWQNVIKNTHNPEVSFSIPMYRWLNSLDGKFPRPEIAYVVKDKNELLQREREHIAMGLLKGWNLVNIHMPC